MASLSMSNKAWYDKAFISVAQMGGSEVQLTAKTNSMSLPQAGIGFESIEVFVSWSFQHNFLNYYYQLEEI